MSNKPPHLPGPEKSARGEAERSLRLYDLALGVASCGHDLNNWLTVAVSNLDLAQAEIGRSVEELELCRTALDRAIALVQEALRGEASSHESCDVAAAIHGVLRLGHTLWATQVVVESEMLPMPRATIPRRDVQRVVLNLILNAVAAMPGGGVVNVRAWSEGDTVVIEVRDTGPGFPETAFGEHTQPFASTHASGFGLGLAGSELLVHRAGGRLLVGKHAGGGAVVQLTIPAAAGAGQGG